jgi:hypothetical protein
MKTRIQLCVLVCLMALGSFQMAFARGQAAPTGHIVICSEQGLMTVLVDADGQPTGDVHLCPDCALNALVILATPCGLSGRAVLWSRIKAIGSTLCTLSRENRRAPARGPPFPV